MDINRISGMEQWFDRATLNAYLGRPDWHADRTDTLLRRIGTKYFPQGYNIEDDKQKNTPRAFFLEMQIEHMTGKRVHEK